jgi:pilus assembly protein CpaF
MDNLSSLFNQDTVTNYSTSRMFELLRDPSVSQIVINRFDRVFYSIPTGTRTLENVFPDSKSYINFINELLFLTDVAFDDVLGANASFIEGSFDSTKTDIQGSIHLATKEITRGDPSLTVRKQPRSIVTLEKMVQEGMLNDEMKRFLETAVRGRANILISGGSGAGKTTMARALSWYIDAEQRILTAEEIDELHIDDRLPNVVSLTTHRHLDSSGNVTRTVELQDLVKEALRMRADRIWVGETRGKEAYALVKACNSGHDGSCTTIHSDNGKQAIKQLITYVMESGVTEEVAREQVARAFHLVIQISKGKLGRRVITEISELEPVREGNEQRINTLYRFNHDTGLFETQGQPSNRLLKDWARYGTSWR